MIYTVQPFELFDEHKPSQLPDKVYMREFATLEMIKEVWERASGSSIEKTLKDKLHDECSSYHGSYGGKYNYSFYPKEITIEIPIFERVKWKNKEEDLDNWEKKNGVWQGHCDLIIKFKKHEFLKLLYKIYGKD